MRRFGVCAKDSASVSVTSDVVRAAVCGVFLEGAASATMSEVVVGGAETGVSLGDAAQCRLDGCTMCGGKVGVRLSSPESAHIASCTLEGCREAAVLVRAGAKPRLSQNVLQNSRRGVVIEDGGGGEYLSNLFQGNRKDLRVGRDVEFVFDDNHSRRGFVQMFFPISFACNLVGHLLAAAVSLGLLVSVVVAAAGGLPWYAFGLRTLHMVALGVHLVLCLASAAALVVAFCVTLRSDPLWLRPVCAGELLQMVYALAVTGGFVVHFALLMAKAPVAGWSLPMLIASIVVGIGFAGVRLLVFGLSRCLAELECGTTS